MNVNPTASASSTSTKSAFGDALDPMEQKEMFLRMLVAQLKNQDPMSPMEDKEFLGQMAQFSAVEQMSNVAQSMTAMQGASEFTQSVALIGKQVDYLAADGSVVTGSTVNAVSTAGGTNTKLILDSGMEIKVTDVVKVA